MSFDAKKVKNDIVAWIRDWFEINGKGCNAIVSISGGKDSSVAAALCVEALGKDRVIGVLMPNGEQHDIDMSYLLVNHLGIEHYVVNIKDGYDGLLRSVEDAIGDMSDAAVDAWSADQLNTTLTGSAAYSFGRPGEAVTGGNGGADAGMVLVIADAFELKLFPVEGESV